MRLAFVVWGLAGCLLIGCSKGGSTGAPPPAASTVAASQSPAASAPAGQGVVAKPTPAVVLPRETPPEQVVATFLQALRSGDSGTTEALLTTKAREELARHQMSVDVQSAPNASYQVHAAQLLPDHPDNAHVSSVWTEKFEDGEETYEIIWALRRQPEGWRVAGMAMQLVPDQPPQFLNFEDPEEMLRKREEAMAALEAAAQTAQQPAPGSSASPRIER
jgi:hypothetical protein